MQLDYAQNQGVYHGLPHYLLVKLLSLTQATHHMFKEECDKILSLYAVLQFIGFCGRYHALSSPSVDSVDKTTVYFGPGMPLQNVAIIIRCLINVRIQVYKQVNYRVTSRSKVFQDRNDHIFLLGQFLNCTQLTATSKQKVLRLYFKVILIQIQLSAYNS